MNTLTNRRSLVMLARLRKPILAMMLSALVSQVYAADAPSAEAPRDQLEKRLQEAQERLNKDSQEVDDIITKLYGAPNARMTRSNLNVQRPMLGMTIVSTFDKGNGNEPGVRVLSVSPGGPAEAAGLKANDLIVSFDGKPVRDDPSQAGPPRLLKLIADSKVGEPVTIEYRRDGKTQKTQITPRSAPEGALDSLPPGLPALGVGNRILMQRFKLGAFGDTEMVELSSTLGKYFGTDKGLLVVRAPKDDRYKLQDGDVIIDIDGRIPTSVAHATKILSSYNAGEKVKLHIMRQQKRMELLIEVPEGALPTAALLGSESRLSMNVQDDLPIGEGGELPAP